MTRVHVGIDVGGTNTDAAAISARRVLASRKTPTTEDVTDGVVEALTDLLKAPEFEAADIDAVMIGTTHFTNAVVEAKGLVPTATVRLCGEATLALPPFTDWPERLREVVDAGVFTLGGGHEFDGREIAPTDPAELRKVCDAVRDAGVESVAISSVFSPVNDGHEREAAEMFTAHLPEVALSLSSEIGRVGLLERENATILNACLRPLAIRIMNSLETAMERLGVAAPLYLSQNDGTLMGTEFSSRYPVATFASGPTNSMRGAAHLSDEADCAVIDIGGTTSDVGILRNGFPREASMAVDIAGVRTNFRMPDVLSLGIGGGSIVHADGEVHLGPSSVGHGLTKRALVFGGDTLTATDIAVAAGLAEIGDPGLVDHLDEGLVRDAAESIRNRIGEALDRMKQGPEPVPVVVVGGGSILVSDDISGASRVIRPEHYPVANAIGAGISQVGGQVDRVVALNEVPRNEALSSVRQEAKEKCVTAGAIPDTVEIVEVDEIPLAYLPSNAVRIKMKAVGDLEG